MENSRRHNSLRDVRHLARGDAVDHHLHQGQDTGLFATLVVSEQLRREAAPAHLGHAQGARADPCRPVPTRVVS